MGSGGENKTRQREDGERIKQKDPKIRKSNFWPTVILARTNKKGNRHNSKKTYNRIFQICRTWPASIMNLRSITRKITVTFLNNWG